MRLKTLWLAPVIGAFAVSAAQAAEPIKIGFVTTLTTPASIIGRQMTNAVAIALDHIGHKMGGRDVKVIIEDDGLSPKTGKQKTDKLLKKDNVDIMTGYIWSHVLAASAPAVLKAGKIFISANAGYSAYAGKKCHKNFFNMSWENGENARAMGALLQEDKSIKKLYIMAPNYAAGKDVARAAVDTFKGDVVGRDMTPMKHSDWSAELAKVRASGADAVFVFYPGAWGPKFLTQYQQAGMYEKYPLYNVFTIDNMTLPLYQKAKLKGILGSYGTAQYTADMDSPQNKRFVADFKKRTGNYPSYFAAQSYEAIMLIKSGADAVRGNMKDTDGLRTAMEKVDFPTLRDKFRFGKNHYPIQNYYARKVVVDKDGKWVMKTDKLALKDHETPHAKDCKL